jgi:hypothetical protein
MVKFKEFLGSSIFTDELRDMQHGTQDRLGVHATEEFDMQHNKFRDFEVWSAFSMLFAYINLVRYLNDCFPRLAVLVSALGDAMIVIFWFMVIIILSACGFIFWGFFMFGSTIGEFSTMQAACVACIEMIFGEVEHFVHAEEHYPIIGLIYYLLFIIWLLWLQNISKAVILACFTDACKSAGEQSSTADIETLMDPASALPWGLGKESNPVGKCANLAKKAFNRVRREFKALGDRAVPKSRSDRRAFRNFLIYGVFIAVYMSFLMIVMKVDLASELTASMTQVITETTFESSINAREKTFFDIESSEDVEDYLKQIVPKVMFNSSDGTFEGNPNPLKLYQSALPSVYNQLVINHFNIIMGQHPVQITAQYYSMHRITKDEMVRGIDTQDGQVLDLGGMQHGNEEFKYEEVIRDHMVTSFGGIVKDNTRDVVERRCKFRESDAEKGFVCMLSVDDVTTENILQDMIDNELISNQTAGVKVDFVIFNGHAELNLHVGIKFAFNPSGLVDKEITTDFVTMALFSDARDALRIILEVVLWIFSVYYTVPALQAIVLSVRSVWSEEKRLQEKKDREEQERRESPVAVQTDSKVRFAASPATPAAPTTAEDGHKKHRKHKSKFKRKMFREILDVVRIVLLDFLTNPFNTLDLFSSICTMCTLVLWYKVAFSPFRGFYFPERPEWNTETCDLFHACAPNDEGDAAVIQHFAVMGKNMREFMRFSAVNTVIVFVRILRYTQDHVHVRTIFLTLRASFADILWFVLMLAGFLFGYTNMGCLLFGTRVRSFRNMASGIESCVQIILGTFPFSTIRSGHNLFFTLASPTPTSWWSGTCL